MVRNLCYLMMRYLIASIIIVASKERNGKERGGEGSESLCTL